MASAAELEDDLKVNITVDEVFRHGDAIRWPIAKSGGFYWQTLKIEFRGFVVGKGDEDEDEPEFLVTGQVTPDGVGYVRYPTGMVEPPSIATEQPRQLLHPVVEYHRLHDRQPHRVVVICNAIDADGDSLWEQFLSSLDSDIRASVGTAMASISMPASIIGSASSPRALMNFFLSKLGSLLTDDPEVIGENTLVDMSCVWRREPQTTNWTALKFLKHKIRNKDPWYLTMWRLELDAGPFALTSSGVQPPPAGGGVQPGGEGIQPGSGGAQPGGAPPAGQQEPEPKPEGNGEVGMSVDQPVDRLYASIAAAEDRRFAAVIRILQGEEVKSVAKEYGLKTAELSRARELMLGSGAASFEGFLRMGLLGEIKMLRDEIAKLKKRE